MATAAQTIARAARERGTTESPAGSNRVKYWTILPAINGNPWCGAFIIWVWNACGVSFDWTSARRFVSTVAGLADARKAGIIVTDPRPGDVAWFNFDSDAGPEHVALVVDASRWSSHGELITIEGNTSRSDNGSQANGGIVAERRRYRRNVIAFARPTYDTATRPAPKPSRSKPARTPAGDTVVRNVQAAVHASVDGDWGPATDRAVNAVRAAARGKYPYGVKTAQHAVGAAADGIVGPKTRAATVTTVKRLQALFGTTADGIWGPNTDRAWARTRNTYRGNY